MKTWYFSTRRYDRLPSVSAAVAVLFLFILSEIDLGGSSVTAFTSNSATIGKMVRTPQSHRRRVTAAPSFAFRTTSSIDATSISSSSSTSTSDGGIHINNSTQHDGYSDDNSVSSLSTTSPSTNGSKLRRLKDMMWIRETLEDLTAAEFACTVETGSSSDTATTGAGTSSSTSLTKMESTETTKSGPSSNTNSQLVTAGTKSKVVTRPRKRAVDYEKLLRQLNQRLRDLGCSDVDAATATTTTATTTTESENDDDGIRYKLEPGVGMGTLTYTEQQRNALLDRIVRTRTQLIEIIHGNQIEMSDTESIPAFLQKNLPSLPRMEIPKEDVGEDVLSPKLYVRDDGTVDWDGALTSGAALRKFGTAVWARINGRETDSMDDHDDDDDRNSDDGDNANNSTAMTKIDKNTLQLHGTSSKPVTVRIVETAEIVEARESLFALRDQLTTMEREHYKLLNSVISQGQATANVKLATLAPKIRGEIQASAVALENMKVRVSFQTLLYELERIYTYLMGELGNPSLNGYIPLQDRLNVAEFGLLESQVDTFNRQFMENDTVDEDVLAVVFEQLTDFKRRLGIDYYVAGLSFDREAIGTWLGDLWVKTKKGLAFYVKGVRLFWNDLVFCLRLINRAAQGYTLKPREVRTIR